MTRNEFIAFYKAKHPEREVVLVDGKVLVWGEELVPVPCNCEVGMPIIPGSEPCPGWAMVSPREADKWIRLYEI